MLKKKMTFMVTILCLSILFLAPLRGWALPSADAIYLEYDLGGGGWKYRYTLENTTPITDPGYNAYDFYLFLNSQGTPTDIQSPTDWDSISGLSFIDWFSTKPGPPTTGTDLPPGESLSNFDFTINTRLVTSLRFEVTFTDPNDPNGVNPYIIKGESQPGAAPIPEPTTLLLLGSGLAGTGFLRRRKILKGIK